MKAIILLCIYVVKFGNNIPKFRYSHSIVAGGLLVTSRTTRLTSGTVFVMRVEILARTS